jgi:deoxyribose-phosphate aldolase
MSPADGGVAAMWTADEVAATIDHTLLKPDATAADVGRLCDEALQHRFFSVCINPVFVTDAVQFLGAAPINVCTVAGFPLGATLSEIKAEEARRAIGDGASEIDMVLFVGGLKARQDDAVRRDIEAVASVCREGKAVCKVILEVCLLTPAEKERACDLCVAAGADFVKTSTGLSTGGATVEDVKLMSRRVADRGLGVKAAGGIRTRAAALAMLDAGATRIGSSNSVAIIRETIAALERERDE